MSPRVSVIVPVYNVAAHVGACIASLAAQTLTDFEVIVVDDGSTDGSGPLARSAARGDPRFVFIDQANGGLSAARNTGLDAARGTYLCFVDSDDTVTPDYLDVLMRALEESGLDWVACGIAFVHPDGSELNHSGLHGTPEPGAAPERHDMGDWCEVVRIFPSAWNKIYRRDLVGDLRFDEGLNYEDHAFYYRYALRAGDLLRLPDQLYRNTRGREGQITGDGSEAVFQQFDVLEILAGIMAGTDRFAPREGISQRPKEKTGAAIALARIITRLTFERLEVVRDPDRRRRFVARARSVLAAKGQAGDPALGVPAWWMQVLAGDVPLSVIIPSDGNRRALEETLASLEAQNFAEFETLVVADATLSPIEQGRLRSCLGSRDLLVQGAATGRAGPAGPGAARNFGLARARGQAVVFLDAGDLLPPRALAIWHNRLWVTGADMGVTRMRHSADGSVHKGFHDRGPMAARLTPEGCVPAPGDALLIHAHPSAKIYRRSFLAQHGLAFPAEPLGSWNVLIAAVTRATRLCEIEAPPVTIAARPETRQFWHRPNTVAELNRALDRIGQAAAPGGLPPDWRRRLFARAVWEKINFADFADMAARRRFETEARHLAAEMAVGKGPDLRLDPYIGARVREIMGLTAQ